LSSSVAVTLSSSSLVPSRVSINCTLPFVRMDVSETQVLALYRFTFAASRHLDTLEAVQVSPEALSAFQPRAQFPQSLHPSFNHLELGGQCCKFTLARLLAINRFCRFHRNGRSPPLSSSRWSSSSCGGVCTAS
jgi:hypothetical protein